MLPPGHPARDPPPAPLASTWGTSPPAWATGNNANATSRACQSPAGHGLNQITRRHRPVGGLRQRDSAWRQPGSSPRRTLRHFPFPVLPRHGAPVGKRALPRSQRTGGLGPAPPPTDKAPPAYSPSDPPLVITPVPALVIGHIRPVTRSPGPRFPPEPARRV